MKLTLDIPNRALAMVIGGGLCFAAGSVIATEFPSESEAMHYSGLLTDSAGVPRTGDANLEVELFDAPINGTRLCGTETVATDLGQSQGRFRLTLPADCLDATRDAGDAWAQVSVEGTALPRQKVGATPYALVARDALSADTAQSVAAGAIDTDALAPGAVTTAKLDPTFVARVSALESSVDALEAPSSASRRYALATVAAQSLTSSQVALLDLAAIGNGTQVATDLDLSANLFKPGLAGLYAVTVSIASDNWGTGIPRLSFNCTSGLPKHNSVQYEPALAGDSRTIRGVFVVDLAVGDTCSAGIGNVGAAVTTDTDPAKSFFEAIRIGN